MRRPGQPVSPLGARGFSLVETTIALVIAILALMILGSLFYTVTSTRQGQDRRRQGNEAATHALERLTADLTGSLPAGESESVFFELLSGPDTQSASRLTFTTVVYPHTDSEPRWEVAEQVQYNVQAESGPDARLLRTSRPVAGPGADLPPRTNILAHGVSRFRVEFYDGEDWRSEWAPEENKDSPVAARIVLGLKSGRRAEKTFHAETFIPTGNPVPSTIDRNRAP